MKVRTGRAIHLRKKFNGLIVHTYATVLEWVSIYWFSRAGPAASLRIYWEMTNGYTLHALQRAKYSSIPFGVAYFPKDLTRSPRKWVTLYRLPTDGN